MQEQKKKMRESLKNSCDKSTPAEEEVQGKLYSPEFAVKIETEASSTGEEGQGELYSPEFAIKVQTKAENGAKKGEKGPMSEEREEREQKQKEKGLSNNKPSSRL